jgi:hypothetical protein
MAYTRADLIRAGQVLADDNSPRSEHLAATETLGEWREHHGPLLKQFDVGLRTRLRGIDDLALVGQRLKRTPSIVSKLRKMQTLKLPNMQDIGGIRSVVANMDAVRTLELALKTPDAPFELANRVDHIANPKNSGYRSLHLVYRNGAPPPGNGTFQLELQIRTRLQHAWATAVETVDAFQQQALKAGAGRPEWQDYFFWVSGAFAYYEGCEPHPFLAGKGREVVCRTAISESKRLLVRERLRNYTTIMQELPQNASREAYYLLRLYPEDRRNITEMFALEHLGTAAKKLAYWESKAAAGEPLLVALVSAGTIDGLKLAYPNYFLDTQEFVKMLDRIEAELAEVG